MNPPAGRADLHVHTTHSDGSCSPCEVVHAASCVKLAALAITDHDSLSALAIARPEAERLGVELVSGIEMTTEHDGRELHVLGYFIRADDVGLASTCTALRVRRAARIEEMSDRLASLGLRVDLGAIRRTYPRATIGRRHLADWLALSGQVSDRREAFASYLGDGQAAEVPKPRVPIAEAISIIRGAGGVAALAHPPYDLREPTLNRLVGMGLAAIEVDGPGIARSRQPRVIAWADQFDLIPVAGSDFHAHDKPGRWVGSTTIAPTSLERLRAIANPPNA